MDVCLDSLDIYSLESNRDKENAFTCFYLQSLFDTGLIVRSHKISLPQNKGKIYFKGGG